MTIGSTGPLPKDPYEGIELQSIRARPAPSTEPTHTIKPIDSKVSGEILGKILSGPLVESFHSAQAAAENPPPPLENHGFIVRNPAEIERTEELLFNPVTGELESKGKAAALEFNPVTGTLVDPATGQPVPEAQEKRKIDADNTQENMLRDMDEAKIDHNRVDANIIRLAEIALPALFPPFPTLPPPPPASGGEML